ncbi:unnamed protein product [Moneuplotes crassus]|uniref:Leucine-rich repeat-containing protein 61 n=2 Tax=Euplotes crassus TaxID=5936 RepID=A0AAD1XXI2_EUPCR|nr:unnamed protein product [Moneuplotes crassus]
MEREVKLTPNYIKTVSKKFDLKIVFLLDIKKQGVTAIGSVPECTNLLMLDLSHNKILMLNGIGACVALTHLNVAYNKLSQLSPLKDCRELVTLMAQGNRIKDFKNIESLSCLKHLSNLYLKEFSGDGANPVCDDDDYAEHTFEVLPSLFMLDGQVRGQVALEEPEEGKFEADCPEFTNKEPWYSREVERPFNVKYELSTELEQVEAAEDTLRSILDDCEGKLKKTRSIYNI